MYFKWWNISIVSPICMRNWSIFWVLVWCTANEISQIIKDQNPNYPIAVKQNVTFKKSLELLTILWTIVINPILEDIKALKDCFLEARSYKFYSSLLTSHMWKLKLKYIASESVIQRPRNENCKGEINNTGVFKVLVMVIIYCRH